MTLLETEMKELGRSTWNDTQHNIADPYLSSMSQTSSSRKKLSGWKEHTHTHSHTHTHTHTHTHKQLFADVLRNSCSQFLWNIHRNTPVLETLFMFPCEYGKICRKPLVAASVPCFFLKLFLKLFVHLYYLFHYLNKTLCLRCIITCHFLRPALYGVIFVVSNLKNITSELIRQKWGGINQSSIKCDKFCLM